MSTPMPRPAPVIRTTFFSDMSAPPAWRGGFISPTPRQHRFSTAGQGLPRGVLAVTLSGRGPDHPRTHGRQGGGARGGPRVPHHPPRPDHPRRRRPSPAGHPRRVKGLRREEVALLAGVSPEYYMRLERGQATGPSPRVVDSVAACCVSTTTNAPTWPAARCAHPRGPQAAHGRGQGRRQPRRPGAAGRARPPPGRGLQRPARRPRRQLARAGALRADVRPPGAAEQRPLPVPRRAPGPTTCSPSGNGSPATPSRSCASRPAAAPTTPRWSR